MANNVQLKFNRTGFRMIRTTPEVRADMERRAQNIADAANAGLERTPLPDGGASGFLTDSQITKGRRVRVAVYTSGIEARKAEARERKLTRALDAGRS